MALYKQTFSQLGSEKDETMEEELEGDKMLMASKTEEEATSQVMWAAARS